MRRKPHSNRFKRLRNEVRALVAAVGGMPAMKKIERYAVYETMMVPTRRFTAVIVDGEKHDRMAIRIQMKQGSPRRIYQEAKRFPQRYEEKHV